MLLWCQWAQSCNLFCEKLTSRFRLALCFQHQSPCCKKKPKSRHCKALENNAQREQNWFAPRGLTCHFGIFGGKTCFFRLASNPLVCNLSEERVGFVLVSRGMVISILGLFVRVKVDSPYSKKHALEFFKKRRLFWKNKRIFLKTKLYLKALLSWKNNVIFRKLRYFGKITLSSK